MGTRGRVGTKRVVFRQRPTRGAFGSLSLRKQPRSLLLACQRNTATRESQNRSTFMFGIYFIKLRLKRAIGPDFCCLEKIARLVAGECGRAIESEGAAREESAPSEKLLEGAESGGGSRRAPVARGGDALFPAPRESDGARSTCSDLATRSTGPR